MEIASQPSFQPFISNSTTNQFASWVEINKSAFNHNIALYKSAVGNCLLAPVIKSNAYGHGLTLIGQLCQENPLVDYLCVVSLSEAITLRHASITKPILVLSILDNTLDAIALLNIDVVVYDLETAQRLNKIGAQFNKLINVHIKVDSGLGRLGVAVNQAYEFACTVAAFSHLKIKGIFTHLADSENHDQSYTNYQLACFNKVITHLESTGITVDLKHSSCSAAITANPKSHFNMTRLGLGIYGLWPSQENKLMTQKFFGAFNLQPVLTWKSKLIQTKELPAGSFVGYDCTYQTQRTTKVGIVPVGYWDGLDRRLSNSGALLVNNIVAPIIGRVAMNLTIIDITGIPAQAGDHVTVVGNHPEVTADRLAAQCHTINYEIVTRINPLLHRILA